MKKKLLVSFSGGETSAYMAKWLKENKEDEYEMIFVFANTGEENEETLIFADQCDKAFGLNLVWVEGVHNPIRGKGTTHKIVSFETASRNGEPFRTYIPIYGLPNRSNPQCTRELKAYPIASYARSLKWKKYHTAIGIRVDEIDRMNPNRKKKRLYYPLCEDHPTTKPQINTFWNNMPFRLQLKGYEGNCKWCWKKNIKKLVRIAKDHPERFDFPVEMEEKYGNFFPKHRIEAWTKKGKEIPKDITFFREKRSAKDILEMAKTADPIIFDDSENYVVQQYLDFDDEDESSESCEVWSECKS